MQPPLTPPPPIRPWQAVLAVIVIGGAFALSAIFGSSSADVPVRRALKKTLGADVGKVEVSDVAAFTDVDGSSYRIDIVCGWAGKSRRRAFAAIVQHSRSRDYISTPAYWLKELAIEPPPGRLWLERERQLLDACKGPARP